MYYNDNDAAVCEWLRELIADGCIPAGEIDSRSIAKVQAEDLKGHGQVHLFAGVGGWSYALKLAGWPEDRPVWTISCPCPPFSAAGKKKSCPSCGSRPVPCPRRTGYFICLECEHAWHVDERHLWPEAWRLVRDCSPGLVFGEQVASADGRIWFAGVRATLEALGYSVGCADLCAAGVGAPHIRQRLFWVAYSPSGTGSRIGRILEANAERQDDERAESPHGSVAGRVANPEDPDGRGPDEARHAGGRTSQAGGSGTPSGLADSAHEKRHESSEYISFSGMGHADQPGSQGRLERGNRSGERPVGSTGLGLERLGDTEGGGRGLGRDETQPRSSRHALRSVWSGFDLIPCRDGKARRVEPGTFPLVAGVSRGVVPGGDPSPSEAQATAEARVMRLRGYGNSIVPLLGAEFIMAAMEVIEL